MDRVFERPLPPGLVTLRDWAEEVDRTLMTIHVDWKPAGGFPDPVGVIRSGGPGRTEQVFERDALNTWRAGQPRLWGRRTVRLITGHGESEEVTLGEFAGLSGLPEPDPAADGLPAPDPGGRYRLGELITWHNARPPWAGPVLAATELGADTLVFLGGFARLIDKDGKTVTQCRGKPGFPRPVTGRKYRLGELAAWWGARPGKVPARTGSG